MTKLKKRATALLLGSVTFFMALAMPYNTTRVYAADVAFRGLLMSHPILY